MEIVVGSVLGDGMLVLRSKGKYRREGYFRFLQHIDKAGYVRWLANRLPGYVTPAKVRIIHEFKTLKGKRFLQRAAVFQTLEDPEWTALYNTFYPQRKKVVPDIVLRYLTPLSLAVFYMDDGSGQTDRSDKIFNTQGFTVSDNLKLSYWLNLKFDLGARVQYRKSSYDPSKFYQIIVVNKGRLFKIIGPYIYKIPCMRYKLDGIFKPSETTR